MEDPIENTQQEGSPQPGDTAVVTAAEAAENVGPPPNPQLADHEQPCTSCPAIVSKGLTNCPNCGAVVQK